MKKIINKKAKYFFYIIIFLTAVSIARASVLWYDCDYSQDACTACDGVFPADNFPPCAGTFCFTDSGERNMIPNPSFELDLDGDELPDEWVANADGVHLIKDCTECNAPHGNNIQYIYNVNDVSFHLNSSINVEQNTDYTVSFWAMGWCEDLVVRFVVGDSIENAVSGVEVTNTNDWKHFAETFNTRGNDSLENFSIECDTSILTLVIDAIQLEKGNINTTFKPMPGEYSYNATGNLSTECCGDDPGEIYSHCRAPDDDNIAWNWAGAGMCSPVTDSACCAEASCISPGVNLCYSVNAAHEIASVSGKNDNIAFCDNTGTWKDCDLNPAVCGPDICGIGQTLQGGETFTFGEYADGINPTGCCGDDINESFVPRNGTIPEDLTDYSCCNATDRCVFGGTCYAADQLYCLRSIPGIYNCTTKENTNWTAIISDCNAADTMINDSAWNDTQGCSGASTSCNIFEEKDIPDGGCVDSDPFPGDVSDAAATVPNNDVKDIDGDGFNEGCCNGNWLGANCNSAGCVSADDPGGYSNSNFNYEYGCYGDGDGYCDPLYEDLANDPLDCMAEMVGWTFTEPRHVSLEDSKIRTGAYSLKMNDSVVATQNITGLTPGEKYVVIAYAKKDSGATAQIKLEVDNGSTARTTVTDWSDNDNQGTIYGNPIWTSGKIGTAMEFDGVGDYIDVPLYDSLNISGELTVSVWVYPKYPPTEKGRVFVTAYDWDSVGAEQRGWNLGDTYGNVDHINAFVLNGSGAAASITYNNFFSTYLNKWTHVAMVFKPSQYLKLYINGELVGSDTTRIPADINYTEVPVRIGARADNPTQGHFNGTIDSVAIYNKALLPEEVMSLYLRESELGQDANLVLNMHFNEIAATGLIDPATNDWTRLEATYTVASNGILKVWLIRTSSGEEGDLYVDDVAVINITHEVDDEIQYHHSNYPYGCCASGECWNGTSCQATNNLSIGTELPSPVCVKTDTEPVWQLPYEKEHWYRAPTVLADEFDKYCPLEDQCWEAGYGDSSNNGANLCFEKYGFNLDHFCDPWTTRTAVLAANILDISEQLNHQDFTLSCDSAKCFEQFKGDGVDVIKEKCSQFGLTCTYKSGDTLIAGFLLENSVPDTSLTCKTGPGELEYPGGETLHPDENPKCYFQEILDIESEFADLDKLKMDLSVINPDTFTYVPLVQVLPSANDHVIQSLGFNNKTKIVIFSNKDLNYESLLGDGTDLSPLDDQFPRLRKYLNEEIVSPDNINILPTLLSWTRDFDAIFINKKDNISIEALIESKNNPPNYFTILYENVSNENICQNLEDRYLSDFGKHNILQFENYFNCTYNNTLHSNENFDFFSSCYAGSQACDEAKVYQTHPDTLYPLDPYFEFDIWRDLTLRFRNFSNCITNRGFSMSSVPSAYGSNINKSEDFVVYNNRNAEGCCPASKCWNGYDCSSEYELFDYAQEFEEPKFVCLDGKWEDAYLRYDWNRVEKNYCVDADQCYLPGSVYPEGNYNWFKSNYLDPRRCTSTVIDYFYYYDDYCLNGNWTTRTALIATEFLDFIDDEGFDDYTLFCDDYTKTLNVIDFFDTEQDIEYKSYLEADTTNNFCVLRYYDTADNRYEVAFGTSLNNHTLANVSKFIENIFGTAENIFGTAISSDACDSIAGEEFGACFENKIWWNNAAKIIIVNKDGMALTPGFFGKVWQFLLNPIRAVITWVQSLFAPGVVYPPEDFDKYYTFVKDTKAVIGVVTNKTPTDRFVVVSYEDFAADITKLMLRRSTDINVSGRYNVSSTFFDLLFRDWVAMTARTRVQE